MSDWNEQADIETASADYAGRFAGRVGAWMLDVQAAIVRELTGAPHGNRRLLDVGGGHAQVCGMLHENGWLVTVHGSDSVCAARIPEALRPGFVVADPLHLPFPGNFFERVVCLRLLTHCRQWEALIAELCRVSRGAVIIDYPVCGGINRWAPALFNLKKKMEGNTRHWRQFNHTEVYKAFASAGFERVARRPQFFWPMVLHRKLRHPGLSRAIEAAARRLTLTSRFGSPVIVRMERRG